MHIQLFQNNIQKNIKYCMNLKILILHKHYIMHAHTYTHTKYIITYIYADDVIMNIINFLTKKIFFKYLFQILSSKNSIQKKSVIILE